MTEMEHTYEAPDPNDAFWHIVLMVLEERARAVTVQTTVEDREAIHHHLGELRRIYISPAVRSEVRLLQVAHVHPIPPAAESRDRIRRLLNIVTAVDVLQRHITPPAADTIVRRDITPVPVPAPDPTSGPPAPDPDTRDGTEIRASLLELD